ncbi:helix-turn-helix domain-containing protein [Streptomyces sp. NPDC058691]|uniref:helix-turn-helix domain-containing protein n=1 Tax=Streptomyces sp. NPDC058691 TaxID=3346601 RepID=UPI00365EFA8E
MDSSNALGDYLRARRELVRPEDAGISSGGLRRVPGLRREEVATLAGISADYYLRLEQGRDRNPSLQVLEALARVLRLDADATAYMIGLTRARRRAPARPERVPQSIRELMDGWPAHPAYVQDRFGELLAVNSLAAALSPNYAPGINLLRAVFLDPAERELRSDWEELTEDGVAALRSHAGADVDDPRLTALVGELSVRSDRFRELWGRHDVQPKRGRITKLRHPQVGDLELRSDKLTIGGTEGLILVVFHAEPGSRDAELLGILGSLSVPGGAPREEPARRSADDRPERGGAPGG